MSNDKELHRFFKLNKSDVPDNGFSERVMKDLPKRNNIFSQIIIASCAVLGLILTVAIQGFTTFFTLIDDLMVSISHFQIPSSSSVMAFFTGIILMGSVYFAVRQSETV